MKNQSRKVRGKNGKHSWANFNWWTHTPLKTFAPLLSFASQDDIEEQNWKTALWHAMGKENFCWVTSSTKDGPIKKRTWVSELTREEALREVTPDLPMISGQEATSKLARELRTKMRQILDCILAKATLVDRQRRGKDDTAWIERTQKRDLTLRLTGHESDYSSLPWLATHFEDYREILHLIQETFETPETREAIIHISGFLYFKDEGEDATRTFGWMLMGLVDSVFEQERAALKKCPSCEKYFIHESLKRKDFCSTKCRNDFRNDGRQR